MGAVVRTAEEFAAAIDAWANGNIGPAVVSAQKEVVSAAAAFFVNAKATWSKLQPNDFWSGQFRASVTIGMDPGDFSNAPDNPGPWPIHPNPYPAADIDSMMGALSGLAPFQIVYINDGVSYAADVEAHAAPLRYTAAATLAMFEKGYSWAFLADKAASETPF